MFSQFSFAISWVLNCIFIFFFTQIFIFYTALKFSIKFIYLLLSSFNSFCFSSLTHAVHKGGFSNLNFLFLKNYFLRLEMTLSFSPFFVHFLCQYTKELFLLTFLGSPRRIKGGEWKRVKNCVRGKNNYLWFNKSLSHSLNSFLGFECVYVSVFVCTWKLYVKSFSNQAQFWVNFIQFKIMLQ